MASSSTNLFIPKKKKKKKKRSFKYDVFLSFRGEDTNNFVGHLYHALQQKGIQTYKDDEKIEKGKTIDAELIKSIEDSRFYIIVFSKNYACSSWCLDELVKIIECQKSAQQAAYPIFYDVEPAEVRKQSGTVNYAFAKHEKKDAARKWIEALKQASNLAGWELKAATNGVHDGTRMMLKMMRGRKVLIVLDDVDNIDQLEVLAGEPNSCKSGSRIIITTRDEQILVAHRVNIFHNINLLSHTEAICLFSRYAFRREIPVQGSQQVVQYGDGLLLTIKVLGSFLRCCMHTKRLEHRRLWNYEEIEDILASEWGTQATKCNTED